MKKLQPTVLISLLFTLCASNAFSSLVGPWLRYDSPELGFQIPVSYGWKVTSVPNGIVFAMQHTPDPYVRVAVGRVEAQGQQAHEIIIQHWLRRQKSGAVQKPAQIDGHKGILIEGQNEEGSYRDVFVMQDKYLYWIGFAAEKKDLWSDYSKTFDIVTDGFRFSH